MSAKHTPGPWQVHSNVPGYSGYIVGDIDGPLDNSRMNYSPVCEVCDTTGDTTGEAFKANCALIAAAPDLLAACVDYLADRKEAGCTADSTAVKRMRAAVARATGAKP